MSEFEFAYIALIIIAAKAVRFLWCLEVFHVNMRNIHDCNVWSPSTGHTAVVGITVTETSEGAWADRCQDLSSKGMSSIGNVVV